jgi:hypothetical protein
VIALHRSGLSGDLHIDSIGVLHMQTGKIPCKGVAPRCVK